LNIQIVQDLICPWCRIGHHNLEQALATWSAGNDAPVTIEWLPYQLDPLADGAPKEDFRQRFTQRKGVPEAQMNQMFDRVTQVGASLGLTFNFDEVTVAVDTLPGHVAIAAAPQAKQPALVAALHTAYFEDGRDIGETDVIVEYATKAGLDAVEIESVRAALASPTARAEQKETVHAVQEAGITSVPYFVFDGKLALSGGQPVPAFLQALEQASEPALAR
jgi:predicted DsbA family dithiol-disulfide isomerase